MIVIGFQIPVEHDHSVAVILDGELVFATEEERFTRHKHSFGEPPINALKQAYIFLKKKYGIKPKEVDAYAINWDMSLFPFLYRRYVTSETYRHNVCKKINEYEGFIPYLINFIKGDIISLSKKLIKKAIIDLGEETPEHIKVYPVRHHLAHAASAYYFSGFNHSTVLTIDGLGEYESTVVWKVKDGEFEPILSMYASHASLGFLYESLTASIKLGYPLEGPGKGMGLAPYGKESKYYDKLKEFVKINPDKDKPYTILLNGKEIKVKGLGKIYSIYQEISRRVIGKDYIDWNPRGELNEDAANIAWAVQKVTEEAVLATAEWARNNTGEKNLALAGGVALNAKANMEIYYKRLFDDIFIFPAANDAGGPIGAAAYVYEHVLGGKMKRKRIDNVYWGPEYSDEEIKKVVQKSKFKAEYIGDDVGQVAELVAKGLVVTWYKGRAEFGPRALGHRSILADPRRKDYWRLVNDIKGREWWRPLAPSLLLEDVNTYFKDPTPHEFMILMFRFKDEEACKRVPVVCHVDLTARPQTVTGKEDKDWYNLIKAFKQTTGEGLIMNTSFNLAGEPLVETPIDAIRSFAVGGFDAMYLQGWLITKQ